MTIPSEIYTFGINWFYNVVAIVIVIPVLCWIVIPVFYNNNISNCYEVCKYIMPIEKII